MRQEKRKQKEVFDPDTASLNHPATFATTKRKASSIAESTTPTKKQKKSPDEMLQALKKQFRIYIINELTKSKNKKQTLDTLAARKQMPRVVIDAEDDIHCERSDISNWLRGQKEPNVNLFLTYLRDNKDDIMKELESTTVSSAGPSTATGARPPSPTSSMRSTSTISRLYQVSWNRPLWIALGTQLRHPLEPDVVVVNCIVDPNNIYHI